MHAKKVCKKFMKNFLHTLCLRVFMLYITRASRVPLLVSLLSVCVCVCVLHFYLD